MTKIPNLSSPDSFFQAQNAPKSVSGRRPGWGSLRRSPRPPSRLGRGIPPPHSPSRSTPSASRIRRLRRLDSQAPSSQHKILSTPVRPIPCRGAHSAPPNLAGFKGSYLQGKGRGNRGLGRGVERNGKGRGRRRRNERGRGGCVMAF